MVLHSTPLSSTVNSQNRIRYPDALAKHQVILGGAKWGKETTPAARRGGPPTSPHARPFRLPLSPSPFRLCRSPTAPFPPLPLTHRALSASAAHPPRALSASAAHPPVRPGPLAPPPRSP